MKKMENKTYKEKFDVFVEKSKAGQVDGEMVGLIIVYLAQDFANYNMLLMSKEARFSKLLAEKVQSVDENTGKPISVSKAELIIKDTEEYRDLKETKIDIENIENYINALKFLQKGVLNEYSHMGGT